NWKKPRFGAGNLASTMQQETRPILLMFLVSALLVLLVALVNLTNLMLLRALSRNHDAAVRSALGAPLLRLMLPALGEGLLIGGCGALAGMALALGAWRCCSASSPPNGCGAVVYISARPHGRWLSRWVFWVRCWRRCWRCGAVAARPRWTSCAKAGAAASACAAAGWGARWWWRRWRWRRSCCAPPACSCTRSTMHRSCTWVLPATTSSPSS